MNTLTIRSSHLSIRLKISTQDNSSNINKGVLQLKPFIYCIRLPLDLWSFWMDFNTLSDLCRCPTYPFFFFFFFVFSLFFCQSIFLFFYIYIFLIMYIFLGNVVVYCLTRRSWRVGRPRTPTSIPFAPGANRELCLLFQYRYLY